MRAIVVNNFGGPEMMKIEEIPTPQPGKNEVRIRIHAAGVNPVDTYIRSGMLQPDYIKPPFVLGTDGAGIVDAVGSDVTLYKPGQRVFCFTVAQGCYAQFCVVPDHLCWPLPEKLSFSQGASIGIPYFTAYRALFQTGWSKQVKSVLVHGASGGVGLAACQIAKEAGMTVYGTAGTEDGLKLVKEAGAHHVFNHRDSDYVKKLMEATKGEGVDMIVEMVAHVNLAKDLDIIKKKGIIAVVGARCPVSINLLGKECAISKVGVLFMPKDEIAEAASVIVKGLENGSLFPIVDKEYPMEKAADAHKDIIESSGAKGKLILLIN